MKRKYRAGENTFVRNEKGDVIANCFSNNMARKIARALNAMEPKEVKPAKKKPDYSDRVEYGYCFYCANNKTSETNGKCCRCEWLDNGTVSYWEPKK
jgi:hypothetical protein